MAIVEVQKATSESFAAHCSASTGPRDHVSTWATAPTEGNLLVAYIYCRGSANFTWPAGWTVITKIIQSSQMEMAYKIAGASEGTELAVTISIENADATMGFGEWSGIDATIPLDVWNSNSSGATLTSLGVGPTAATDTADELVVAAFGVRAGGDEGGWSFTNSFVLLGDENTTADGVCQPSGSAWADKIVSATGAQSTTGSWTAAGRSVAIIAAFRAAAGGPAPQTINLTPAVASMSVPDVTVTPGPVSVDLTPAVASMNVPDVSVIPGPVSIDLSPAQAAWGVPDVVVTPGGVTVSLTPAAAQWSSPDVSVVPGPISLALTPAVATWAVPPVAVVLGGQTVALTPAIASWNVPDVVVTPGGATVNLSPAAAAWVVPDVGVVPGPISLGLSPAVATWTVPPVVVVQGGQTVALTPAIASWGVPDVVVVPGAVTINLTPAAAVWGVPDVVVINAPAVGLIPDVVRMVNVRLFVPGASSVVLSTPGGTVISLSRPGASGVTLEPS